jgi:hypothetical protein
MYVYSLTLAYTHSYSYTHSLTHSAASFFQSTAGWVACTNEALYTIVYYLPNFLFTNRMERARG